MDQLSKATYSLTHWQPKTLQQLKMLRIRNVYFPALYGTLLIIAGMSVNIFFPPKSFLSLTIGLLLLLYGIGRLLYVKAGALEIYGFFAKDEIDRYDRKVDEIIRFLNKENTDDTDKLITKHLANQLKIFPTEVFFSSPNVFLLHEKLDIRKQCKLKEERKRNRSMEIAKIRERSGDY